MKQLTIRGISEEIEKIIREKAEREHLSLNKALLRILEESLISTKKKRSYHDLDSLIGCWSEEEAREFDIYLNKQRQIDEELWR